MDYNYTFIKYYDKNYIPGKLNLENNEIIDINLSVGTIISVKVTDMITSTDGNDKVYTQNVYAIPNKPSYTIQTSPFTTFLRKAFDNKSTLEKFVNQNSFYTSDDKFLNETINSNSSNSDLIIELEYSYNWHTGWLEYSIVKDIFSSNGSILNEVHVEKTDLNYNDLINNISLAIVIGIPLLIAGIVIYRKRKKLLESLKSKLREQKK